MVTVVARAINLTTSASLRHAGLHARQAQHDLGASGGGSSQRDFAVMQRGERPRDRDAKTAARADAARRPMKTLTQARQLFWVVTGAVIADRNIHAFVVTGELDCDRAARMTDRIVEQVQP